jgi:hypothetical protein
MASSNDTYQEDRRLHFVQDHICRHLSENITNEEYAGDGVVLLIDKTNILFKVAKSRSRDIIAIEVVENIYVVKTSSGVRLRQLINLHKSIIKGIIRLSIRLTRAFSLAGRSSISAETPSRVSSWTSSPLSLIMSSPAILTRDCVSK